MSLTIGFINCLTIAVTWFIFLINFRSEFLSILRNKIMSKINDSLVSFEISSEFY